MRSLLLCTRPPWPLRGGDRIRTWHLARALADLGPTSVVATRSPDEDPAAIATGLPFLEALHLPVLARSHAAARALAALPAGRPLQQALYDDRGARAAVREALELGVDVIVAHLVRPLPWLPASTPPVIVDVQDALSLQYREAAGRGHGWRRLAMAVERPRLASAEQAAIRRADGVGFISLRDQRAVLPRSDRPWAVLPAVVDPEAFAPDGRPPEPDTLGFVGNLRTAANRDMLLHFARRVFPLVRSERRRARLRILGQGADAEIRRLGRQPGVELVGEVEDVAPELRRCAVTICPQRFGSGVQNKVLQSLAVGTPAVITPPVAEALGAVEGVAVGHLDRTFGMRVVEVLQDPGLRARLRADGLGFIERNHHPRALAQSLRGLIDAVRRAPPG